MGFRGRRARRRRCALHVSGRCGTHVSRVPEDAPFSGLAYPVSNVGSDDGDGDDDDVDDEGRRRSGFEQEGKRQVPTRQVRIPRATRVRNARPCERSQRVFGKGDVTVRGSWGGKARAHVPRTTILFPSHGTAWSPSVARVGY